MSTLMMSRFVMGAVLLVTSLATPATAQDAKAVQGARVYADQKCAMCHSISDKGNKKGRLDDVGLRLSVFDLRGWLVDAKGMTTKTRAPRKPEMKNYDLHRDDIDALVAYMATLKKK